MEREGRQMTAIFINWTPRAVELLKLIARFMGI